MRSSILSLALLLCAACSATTGKEARNDTVSILPGTYAMADAAPSTNADPTCAENYNDVISHLEYLMAKGGAPVPAARSSALE